MFQFPSVVHPLSPADRRALGLGFGLIVGVVALYAPAFGFEFLLSDDTMYVVANPQVKSGISWAGTKWAFTTFEASNWHPLTWLSLMLDVEIFGTGPAGFHITNVALHAIAVGFAFAALRAATGRTGLCFFVAAVFAWHPAHIESVAWIPERKDVLSGAFGFAALLAYVSYAQRGGRLRYCAVALLTGAGLLAKPVLVTWPFALLLLDVWPLGRLRGLSIDCRAGVAPETPISRAATPGKLVLEKVPLFLLSLGASIATLIAQRPAMTDALAIPIGARLENSLVSLSRYLGRYVWPAELSFIDPHPALQGEGWGLGAVAIAGAVCAGLAIFASVRVRRAPYVAVGLLWFLGVLIPMLGLLQVGEQATADRYTYLPYLGLSVALAWSVDAMTSRGPNPLTRRLAIAVGVAFVLALGARTKLQLPVWRTSEALFAHTLEIHPDDPDALIALANARIAAGRAQEATPLVRRSLERNGRHGPSLETLALLLAIDGDLEGAIRAQRGAVAQDPRHPRKLLQFAKLLHAGGQTDEAMKAYEGSLAIQPNQPKTLRLLGGMLLEAGRVDEANKRFDAAVRILEARVESGIGKIAAARALGDLYIERGEPERALPHYSRVLEATPLDRGALRGRARAALEAGQPERAITLVRKALEEGGDDAETRAIEIRALVRLNRFEEAAASLRALLKNHPTHALASWAKTRLARIEAATDS